ncbi:hypothetical protein Q9189_004618 [Teloschistes chrysophthalmus]
MPPFRNPFVRKPPVVNGTTLPNDENAPPQKLNEDGASQRSGYASSRASSSLSIKKREEPSEYKLSGKKQWTVAHDISARSPVPPESTTPRQSFDSRMARPARSSIKGLPRPQATDEEAFEDVGLNDEAKQQPVKKRGIFARFGDNSETTPSQDGSRPGSSHRGFHLPGRKRGQSGQGAELGNIEHPQPPIIKEPEQDGVVR